LNIQNALSFRYQFGVLAINSDRIFINSTITYFRNLSIRYLFGTQNYQFVKKFYPFGINSVEWLSFRWQNLSFRCRFSSFRENISAIPDW